MSLLIEGDIARTWQNKITSLLNKVVTKIVVVNMWWLIYNRLNAKKKSCINEVPSENKVICFVKEIDKFTKTCKLSSFSTEKYVFQKKSLQQH